jgi:UDP-N-acetylmuramyl pentapeptide synthase
VSSLYKGDAVKQLSGCRQQRYKVFKTRSTLAAFVCSSLIVFKFQRAYDGAICQNVKLIHPLVEIIDNSGLSHLQYFKESSEIITAL